MRILISQKSMADRHGQAVDCLEREFTALWAGLFPGAELVPVPNVEAAAQSLLRGAAPNMPNGPDMPSGPDMIVLSGGNDVAVPKQDGSGQDGSGQDLVPERDRVEAMLAGHAGEMGLPLVGVCRGMQFLNVLMGGGLGFSAPDHPVARPHPCRAGHGDEMVNSFHDRAVRVDDLAPGMVPVVLAGDVVEAMAGTWQRARVLAVQWHPERPGGNVELFKALMAEHLSLPGGRSCVR